MSEARERFRRALDKLQFAYGEWARTKADHPEQDRNRLADAAVAAENDVMALYDEAAARVAAGAGDRPPAPSDPMKPFDAPLPEEPAECELDALAALVYGMQTHTWLGDQYVKARWLYDRGVRIRTVESAERAVRPTPRAALTIEQLAALLGELDKWAYAPDNAVTFDEMAAWLLPRLGAASPAAGAQDDI